MSSCIIKSRCLLWLIVFLSYLVIIRDVMANKFLSVPFGFISVGSLFGTASDLTMIAIAEIYGLRVAMKLFWISIIFLTFFGWLCSCIINLPSPFSGKEFSSYHYVLGDFGMLATIQLVGEIFAQYGNMYFLTRLGLLFKGKYFWLRSVNAVIIGDIIYFVFLDATINFINYFYIFNTGIITPSRFAASFLIRIILIILLSFPIALLVRLIKAIEISDFKINSTLSNSADIFNLPNRKIFDN